MIMIVQLLNTGLEIWTYFQLQFGMKLFPECVS
jgi:hypothetical protein